MAGSHTGISSAMLRFSHCAVPVGHVPSTGKALTGSRSPLPASSTAVTRCTKSGARSLTMGGRVRVAVTVGGHVHLVQLGQGRVHGREVALDDFGALLPVGLARWPP